MKLKERGIIHGKMMSILKGTFRGISEVEKKKVGCTSMNLVTEHDLFINQVALISVPPPQTTYPGWVCTKDE